MNNFESSVSTEVWGSDIANRPDSGLRQPLDWLSSGTEVGDYRIERLLGTGGFGQTYLAREKQTNEKVALKRLTFESNQAPGEKSSTHRGAASPYFSTAWARDRFMLEADIGRQLNHPNIVDIKGALEIGPELFLLMGFVEGVPLDRAKHILGRPPASTVLCITRALLSALEYLHEKGYVHRDVKPANVMMTSSGVPVLVDLGATRNQVMQASSAMTNIATQSFAPIEQLGGQVHTQGPWSDIFGVAATIRYLLEGKSFPDARERSAAISLHNPDPLVPIEKEICPGLAAEFVVALNHGLELDPRCRPQSIVDWRAEMNIGKSTSTAPAPAAVGTTSNTEVDDSGLAAENKLLRVAVIDDDLHIAKFVSRVVRKEFGTDPLIFMEPSSFLTELRTGSLTLDLVFVDLHMPGMDGIELLRTIGEHKASFGVIPMSGAAERIVEAAADISRQNGLQCHGVLTKPFKPTELKSIVSSFLDEPAGSGHVQSSKELSPEEIEAGLAAGCVEVVYQPLVLPDKGGVSGFEALARWRTANGEQLGPDAFIPQAERCNLIDDVTWAVTRTALDTLGEWSAAGYELNMSLNFSLDCLDDTELPEKLREIALESGVACESVIVEVTESRMNEESLGAQLEVLTRLRLMGFQLALDDFGTGRSSMDQLRRFPFNEIKIDKSFVHNASSDRKIRLMLETSVRIGKELGLFIVAEGVENYRDYELVRDLGCDMVQGYLVSKPIEKAAIPDFLALRNGESTSVQPD